MNILGLKNNRDVSKSVFFMGKKIDDLTREELIEIVYFSYNELEDGRKQRKHERDFLVSLHK